MPYTLIWAADGTMPGIEIKVKSLNYILRLITIVQTGLRSTNKNKTHEKDNFFRYRRRFEHRALVHPDEQEHS